MWGPGRSEKLKGLGLASVLVWAKPVRGRMESEECLVGLDHFLRRGSS